MSGRVIRCDFGLSSNESQCIAVTLPQDSQLLSVSRRPQDQGGATLWALGDEKQPPVERRLLLLRNAGHWPPGVEPTDRYVGEFINNADYDRYHMFDLGEESATPAKPAATEQPLGLVAIDVGGDVYRVGEECTLRSSVQADPRLPSVVRILRVSLEWVRYVDVDEKTPRPQQTSVTTFTRCYHPSCLKVKRVVWPEPTEIVTQREQAQARLRDARDVVDTATAGRWVAEDSVVRAEQFSPRGTRTTSQYVATTRSNLFSAAPQQVADAEFIAFAHEGFPKALDGLMTVLALCEKKRSLCPALADDVTQLVAAIANSILGIPPEIRP